MRDVPQGPVRGGRSGPAHPESDRAVGGSGAADWHPGGLAVQRPGCVGPTPTRCQPRNLSGGQVRPQHRLPISGWGRGDTWGSLTLLLFSVMAVKAPQVPFFSDRFLFTPRGSSCSPGPSARGKLLPLKIRLSCSLRTSFPAPSSSGVQHRRLLWAAQKCLHTAVGAPNPFNNKSYLLAPVICRALLFNVPVCFSVSHQIWGRDPHLLESVRPLPSACPDAKRSQGALGVRPLGTPSSSCTTEGLLPSGKFPNLRLGLLWGLTGIQQEGVGVEEQLPSTH